MDGYQGIVANDSNPLQESLFKGDQAVLSNQDIEKNPGCAPHADRSPQARCAPAQLAGYVV